MESVCEIEWPGLQALCTLLIDGHLKQNGSCYKKFLVAVLVIYINLYSHLYTLENVQDLILIKFLVHEKQMIWRQLV